MICRSCQQAIPDDALFCSNCGAGTLETNLPTTLIGPPDTAPALNKPEPDLRTGKVLDSKYQLFERLGTGGMGAVYRARRLHIGDEVAVKLMSDQVLPDEHAIERFRREARAAASIRHPNVVSIYDFNDAHEAYIVMELVKGDSLRKILQREGKLSPQRAVALMHSICAGVGVAHRQGLIHRDLKPDNVIVVPTANEGETENAKVVDFGLAKIRDGIVSPLTLTGTVIGTAYYMSPEQCSGEELDARADVYSLAAMFYEMLTGGPPFTGPNLASVITKHLNEPPPRLDESLQIPDALGDVCLRGLAKDRNQRPADAIAFDKAVQDALAGRSDLNVLPPQPGPPKSNAWKWLAAIVIVVLGVGIVSTGLAIKFGLGRASQNNNATNQTQNTTVDDKQVDLRGKWTGTYGPAGTAATLIIDSQNAEEFSGVLEQGATRVEFKGTITSRTIEMQQTKVISGSDWSLGNDVGTLSTDGKRMSGTGKDAISGSLGILYPWSFIR
jgi:serine/threonine protein kinase